MRVLCRHLWTAEQALFRNSYNVPLSTNGAFEPGWGVLCSGLRALSSETLAEKTSFGGLKDEDRIFTNLYGRLDPFIKV